MTKPGSISGAVLAVLSIWLAGCAHTETAGHSEYIDHVTTVEEFRSKVLEADKPVLVDFYTTWCGPCKRLAPVIDKLADEYKDRAKFVKVDVDKLRKLAKEYGITSVPTVLIFKDGKVRKRLVRVRKADEYRAALDAALTRKK
jgi:thioredoxin 1